MGKVTMTKERRPCGNPSREGGEGVPEKPTKKRTILLLGFGDAVWTKPEGLMNVTGGIVSRHSPSPSPGL